MQAIVTIHLGALASNWKALRDLSPHATCGAVVKSNAYGLGAESVTKTLSAIGCRIFFVSHLQEALDICNHLPSDTVFFTFNGIPIGAEQQALHNKIYPVLTTRMEIQQWATITATQTHPPPCIVHVDTGMNRQGLQSQMLKECAPLLKTLNIRCFMSHLACAEEENNPLNRKQRDDLVNISKTFGLPWSLCNSAGIFLGEDFHGALLRPGIAIYGVACCPKAKKIIKPVVELQANILQVRTLIPGDTIGYGCTYECKSHKIVATIPAGYAEGYPFALSRHPPKALLHLDNFERKPVPILGRVSMNLSILDVSHIPNPFSLRGACVTLIGNKLSLENTSFQASSMPYELLLRLGQGGAKKCYLS